MEKLVYVDRRNTNCNKWDGQQKMFGEEGLHAMWVADMDFRVPECVVSALREYVESGVYGYYKIPDAYYQAFIDWEREHHGYEVKKEWIRFSPGVVAGFHWLLQILTEENDAVIVNTPVYYPFLDAVNNNHRNLICSDLKNENGEYSIDFDDFEKKITDHQVKLFILCSPHNPAGRVWKKEELKQLFEICRAHQVYIISDEIHQDLVFGENKHIPSLSTGEYDDIMVSIVAASKTFNIAGAQNSMVIIPDEKLQEKWDAYVKGNRVLGGNAFGYVAAQAAYAGGNEWLTLVLDQIEENYQYLKAELAEKLEIPTTFGETLSWKYLCYVREYPTSWKIPTSILYGEKDSLTSMETIKAFAEKNNAELTVMPGGEHWFHTKEQMQFLDYWIKNRRPCNETENKDGLASPAYGSGNRAGADGSKVKEKRFRYSCHYNVRHPGQCDEQSGYGVTKLDAIVESIVCTKFSEILECSKSKLLQDMLRKDMEVAQKEVSRAKSELDLKDDERNALKDEMIRVIRGKSSIDRDMIQQLLDENQAAIQAAQDALTAAQNKLEEIEQENKKAENDCSNLFTWASTYQNASFQQRQAILNQFIKEVRVGRDYDIEIILNVPLEEFEEFKSHSLSVRTPSGRKTDLKQAPVRGLGTPNGGIVVFDKTSGEAMNIMPKSSAHVTLRCQDE